MAERLPAIRTAIAHFGVQLTVFAPVWLVVNAFTWHFAVWHIVRGTELGRHDMPRVA